MEMTDRLSTLHQQARLKVVERVFQKLLLSFGNQLLAKWQGIDMNAVYEDWADALTEFSLGAINHGIESAKNLQHPPSQGEFKELCRAYKPSMPAMLEHKLTPEQIERNRARIADIAKNLAASKKA